MDNKQMDFIWLALIAAFPYTKKVVTLVDYDSCKATKKPVMSKDFTG